MPDPGRLPELALIQLVSVVKWTTFDQEFLVMTNYWRSGLAVRAGRTALYAGVLVALAACGQHPGERTEGGAATGAATGAAVGLVAGPPGVVVGAVIGGGAGALTGAATKPSQVNLGPPPWSHTN
jgi:hypothetical protein